MPESETAEWLKQVDAAGQRGNDAARAVLALAASEITREQFDATLARIRQTTPGADAPRVEEGGEQQ